MPDVNLDPLTTDMVEEWAEATLEEWLDGYFDDGDGLDERHRKITRIKDNIYQVRIVGESPGTSRLFSIAVSAEEVKDEAFQ